MERCININHPDFKDLYQKTGVNLISLKADVELWMDKNNQNEIPSMKDLNLVYNSKTHKELYKQFELLNNSGELKKLSYIQAFDYVKSFNKRLKNNNSGFNVKMIKSFDGKYTIGLQDNYSNKKINKEIKTVSVTKDDTMSEPSFFEDDALFIQYENDYKNYDDDVYDILSGNNQLNTIEKERLNNKFDVFLSENTPNIFDANMSDIIEYNNKCN